ncbi:hypothetical protein VNO77_15792 [Canavalia gladiata]|uniref:MADS-box domain-containing protein n=1 Tax=Canavalia gladiata TaxID=3824 RepID=A0AAN9QRI9_CANGL
MTKGNDEFAKKTKGRQRIEMKKMSNERNLQVTFSKRRAGVFKKASELCTLCSVDMAIVIFSPARRVFSFGSPSVETVIHRYLLQAPPSYPQTMQDIIDAHCTANVRQLNAHFTLLSNQLEDEKKRGDELGRYMKAAQAQLWWASPMEEMNKAQLELLKTKLDALKKLVTRQAERLLTQQNPVLQNRVFDGSVICDNRFNNFGRYGPHDGSSGFY